MGQVNTWLKDQVQRRNPHPAPRMLDAIVHIEDPSVAARVKNTLGGISGVSPVDASSSFLRVRIPTESLDAAAAIPGVVRVSYNAPVTIQRVAQFDPLIGRVQVSSVTVPVTPTQMALRFPLSAPLTPFGLMTSAFARFVAPKGDGHYGPLLPGYVMVPTGKVTPLLGVPPDDRTIAVKVAVIDTGLTIPHPLFSPAIGIPKIFSTTGLPGADAHGHGEWCSATAFGGDFPTRFGHCRSVTHAKNLIAVQALNALGFGTSWSIIKAIDLAALNGARVISMSLGGIAQGGVDEDPSCQAVAQYRDIIFVVAAGNDGVGKDGQGWTVGSPGASPFAVTVAAWSHTYDAPAWFSSRGPGSAWHKDHPDVWAQDMKKYGDRMLKPDVACFGGGAPDEAMKPWEIIHSACTGWTDGLYSLTPGDGFEGYMGTSQSTPQAAGVISYALDRGIIHSADDVKERMARQASKDAVVGWGFITLDKLREV